MLRGALTALLVVSACTTTAWADGDDAAGVAHFKSGVGLFRDGNYAGALAEFEESYRLRPGASALQNIALCQRQLFRYAASIGSLEKMLKSYGGTLSADDKLAAETALRELRERVTKVTLQVTPKNAALLIDGKPVEGNGDGVRRLVLDVGEHTVVASAPGFEDREEREDDRGEPGRRDRESLRDDRRCGRDDLRRRRSGRQRGLERGARGR
jgi:tetratricopeptide (TPR) repeat protein